MIKKIIKKLLLGFVLLYSFNMIVPSKAIISINVITILVVSIGSIFGLFFLLIIKLCLN